MNRASTAFAVALLGSALSTAALDAQTAARYREFELGQNVGAVSALANMSVSNARMLHQRPALLQELFWRRPYTSVPHAIDPVQSMNFSFYNDQLFKIVVDYDRDRTEGLKDEDMIDALTSVYGTTMIASRKLRALQEREDEAGIEVARWSTGDAATEQSIVLYRVSYPPSFRLIVMAPRVDAQARTAQAESRRLDDREAPQREIARQKQEADAARTAEDKAREANKATFRP